MYEKLVKRLRNLSGTDNIAEFDKAADAIEELSRQLAYYHGFDGFLMAHGMFGPSEYVPIEPPKEET